MAIYINLEDGVDKIHDALVGSPAYETGEIALVNDGDKDILCVGENNEDNLTLNVKRAKFTKPLMKEYNFLGGNKMNEMNNNYEMELGNEIQPMESEQVVNSETEITSEDNGTSLGEILISASIGAVVGVASVVIADQLTKRVFVPVGNRLMRKINERKLAKEAQAEEELADQLAEQELESESEPVDNK